MLTSTIATALIFSSVFLAQADAVSDRVQDRQDRIEDRQEARDEKRQERQVKRDEFRQQLQEVRDERKAAIIENIQERFDANQTKWSENWSNALDRLAEILDKIEDRAGETAEVLAARDAIDNAQSEVDAFLAMDFTIEIDSEENVGRNVRTLISSYKSKAREVFGSVKEARQAVKDAAQAAKSDRIDENQENDEE